MRYLLDTCVISEITRPIPSGRVIDWLRDTPEASLFLSVITIGEIQKGISALPASQKRETLQQWLDLDLAHRFEGRVLDVDENVARKWGEIQAGALLEGNTMPAIDSLIAATALAHDMTVITRNVRDMAASSAKILDPWD